MAHFPPASGPSLGPDGPDFGPDRSGPKNGWKTDRKPEKRYPTAPAPAPVGPRGPIRGRDSLRRRLGCRLGGACRVLCIFRPVSAFIDPNWPSFRSRLHHTMPETKRVAIPRARRTKLRFWGRPCPVRAPTFGGFHALVWALVECVFHTYGRKCRPPRKHARGSLKKKRKAEKATPNTFVLPRTFASLPPPPCRRSSPPSSPFCIFRPKGARIAARDEVWREPLSSHGRIQ